MVGIRPFFTCFTQAFHLHSWTGHSQVRSGLSPESLCEHVVNPLLTSSTVPSHSRLFVPRSLPMAAEGTTRYPAPLSHRECPSPFSFLCPQWPGVTQYPPSCLISSTSKQGQLLPCPLPEHPTAPRPLQPVLYTQLLYSLRR